MDGARIPADWGVGEEGDGWRLAVALLAHERSSIGAGGGRQPIPTDRILDLARTTRRPPTPPGRQDPRRPAPGARPSAGRSARGRDSSVGFRGPVGRSRRD